MESTPEGLCLHLQKIFAIGSIQTPLVAENHFEQASL